MINLTARILERPPGYLSLLGATAWETEPDNYVREVKRINSLANMKELNKIVMAEENKIFHLYGALYGRVFAPHECANSANVKKLADDLAKTFDGRWTPECDAAMSQVAHIRDFGLLSLRVVTTVGVGFIVDGFQGIQNISTLRYHGIGTGTNAESTGDTALQTELTTQLTPASTRATGTLTEGASPNIFRTVGSNVVNSSVTVTEHGIFNSQATGGGSLLDRSVFAGIGLVNGNTLQTTYDLTLAAGG